MAKIQSPTGAKNTLDGVAWPEGGGDIPLVAGANVTITPSSSPRQIAIAAVAGTATGMTTVDTVAALQSLSGTSVGDKRYLMGYDVSGDGGYGPVIDTSSGATVNGVTVFSNSSGGSRRWERAE